MTQIERKYTRDITVSLMKAIRAVCENLEANDTRDTLLKEITTTLSHLNNPLFVIKD